MGALVLLLSAFGIVDLVTVFGLVLKPWTVQIRTAAIGVALVLAFVAWIGGIVRPAPLSSRSSCPTSRRRRTGWWWPTSPTSTSVPSSVNGGCGRSSNRSTRKKPDVVVVTGDLVDGDADTVENMFPRSKL